MSKFNKKQQQEIEDLILSSDRKGKSIPKGEGQRPMQVEFASWDTGDKEHDNERRRLQQAMGDALSMLQPVELLAIFQVCSDSIRERKFAEISSAKLSRVKDHNGVDHLQVEGVKGNTPDRLVKLLATLIKECQFAIEMIQNMGKLAEMKSITEDKDRQINVEDIANA